MSVMFSKHIFCFGLTFTIIQSNELCNNRGKLHGNSSKLSSSSSSSSSSLIIEDESPQVAPIEKTHDGYDELQALIVSAPYESKNTKVLVKNTTNATKKLPTLLEREALAVEGSDSSRLHRSEAMDELLDLLEYKGVPPGYAFEFLRHSVDLIDDLICLGNTALESRSLSGWSCHTRSSSGLRDRSMLGLRLGLESNLGLGLGLGVKGDPKIEVRSDLELRLGLRNTRDPEMGIFHMNNQRRFGKSSGFQQKDGSFPSIVSYFAEQAGIPRLVYYFYLLRMKAPDIAKVLPFVGKRIDTVMAKVEFLRTIGVKSSSLPTVLANWPQLFTYECDQLALVEEFLKGLGFTHKELGKFVQKHPQILGQDISKDLRPNVEFLEDLEVPLEHVKKLIIRHPILILNGAEKSLRDLIACLESIGVRRNHIGPLLARRPALISSNVQKDVWPVGDYLKSIHATADDIDKIITSFPRLFRYNLDQDFQPAVLQLENLGVDSILMGKLFRRHPQLLKNRLNFEAKTDFLVKLGLPKKDLGKVIYNAPQLLGLSVEEKIQPTIQFLESLGITGSSLLKVIKRKPMILAHSIDTKLQANTEFLESLGIKREIIGKLVTRHPQLLTLSVDKNLNPTVMYLMELDFTREEVADMVRRLPSLLGFSIVTVLQPKYSYLVEVMQRSPKELVRFPHFFSYSLEKRIIPRHQVIGEAIQLSRSLSNLYGCNDALFEKKLYRWKLVSKTAKSCNI